MKKLLLFSLISLVYITVFKITNFETFDIAFATLLIYIGVPFFVLVSIILFAISVYHSYKEKFTTQSLYFVSLVVNFISAFLFFDFFRIF